MTANMYRVETRPIVVEVNLGHSARVRGEMFLRPSIVTLSGIESIEDRMNDRDAFFPLRAGDTSETVLIGKMQVRYVAADTAAAPVFGDEVTVNDVRQLGDVRQFKVELELDDGEVLRGVFHAVLRPGKRRALDFINGEIGLFVPLFREGLQYVINRSFIRRLKDVTP